MNQEIKVKWTTALRSGNYIQGHKSLRRRNPDGKDTHCCLGVLCDLAVAANVLPAPELVGGEYEYQNKRMNGEYTLPEAGVLPSQVMQWAGLTEPNPPVIVTPGPLPDGKIVGESGMVTLAELNDHGVDFNQIADAIDNDL